jgi:transcriptional regulator with XRE-family HTH domain
MNAIEARKRRGGPTLFEREMADVNIRERVEAERAGISLELQVRDAMESAKMTPADLARLLAVPRSTVSRDLKGGLSNAKLGRVRAIADKLNYDVVPLVLPREPAARKLAIAAYLEKLQ